MLEYFQSALANLTFRFQFVFVFFGLITVLMFFATGRKQLHWDETLKKSGWVNVWLITLNSFAIILPIAATAYALHLLQSLPHLSPLVWNDAPWLVRAFIALLLFDLTNYALHRWMHSNAWSWPLHAVHHSDTDMHFLSANRAHILEWVVVFPITAAVAFFCGLGISDVVFLGLAREAHQYYVHSRLDWDHGPLRHVLASPQFHRWHHVDQPEAHNKNFALFFPFIDLAFGTYHSPHSAKGLPTGFAGNPGENIGKLLLFPFTEWLRLARERFLPQREQSS